MFQDNIKEPISYGQGTRRELPNTNEEEEQKTQDVWKTCEVNALLSRFLADILLWMKDNHYRKQEKVLNDQQIDIMNKELRNLAIVFWMGEVT